MNDELTDGVFSESEIRFLAQEALKQTDHTLSLAVGAACLALLDERAALSARLSALEHVAELAREVCAANDDDWFAAMQSLRAALAGLDAQEPAWR